MRRQEDTRRARSRFADRARKEGRGSRLPSPAQASRFSDQLLLWYTPPKSGGEIERQPALGGGGVAIDAIARTGNHVAKSADAETFRGVTGLWRVKAHFAYENEEKEAERKLWRSEVVSIPGNADAATRSQIIARAVTQMARSILEHDYEVGMALTLDNVWVEREERAERPSAPRMRNRKRDRKRDKARPRKAAPTPKRKTKPAKRKAAPKSKRKPTRKIVRKVAPKSTRKAKPKARAKSKPKTRARKHK
jgi:hypothetical protein